MTLYNFSNSVFRVRQFISFIVGALSLISLEPAEAAFTGQYSGDGTGGPIGGGQLYMEDRGSYVRCTLTKGAGQVQNNIVFFIDSVAGGYADTSGFTDISGPQQRAISGFNGTDRATAYFASGFRADYALALRIDYGGYMYGLTPDADGLFVRGQNAWFDPYYNPNSGTYTFNIYWNDIGLGDVAPGSRGFRFETAYVYDTGYRYLETMEGLTSASQRGFSSVWYRGYNVFGATPVPEVSTAMAGAFLLVPLALVLLRRRRGP